LNERVERFAESVGAEVVETIAELCDAVGRGTAFRRATFMDVAAECRKAGVAPETMLVAVRLIARARFDHATDEGLRIEEAWIGIVRLMMDGYYRRL